jgi:hypothetical protein
MKTYKAILKNNQLTWLDSLPTGLNHPIQVSITLEETALSNPSRRQKRAAALEKLANLGSLAYLDPCQWQQETRGDRILPNRE